MPRQFKLPHAKGFAELATEVESYNEGYECGRTWDKFAPHNDYTPGGPWVWQANPCRTENVYRDIEEASRQNNREWQRGFADARRLVEPKPAPVDHVAVLGYN